MQPRIGRVTSVTMKRAGEKAAGKTAEAVVEDHRVRVNGHAYWVLRLSVADAQARGVGHHDLVKVFNNRGAVICAADVSPLMAPGVVKSFESSAEFEPIVVNGETVDIGGCMNLLTPSRPQVRGTSSMSPNSCLVQVARWDHRIDRKVA